jgi:hypothetical protein
MYTNPYQVSVDPDICLINTEITPTGSTQTSTTYKFASQGSPFKTTISGIQVGQLMNVYINMSFIDKKITEKELRNKL